MEGIEERPELNGGDAKRAAGGAERNLLGEADYYYDRNNWEATHSDFGTLCDESWECYWSDAGTVRTVGRLKELPPVYAVNIPISFHEGEPEDYEVRVFETAEAATAAYAAALAKATPAGAEGK